MSYPYTSFNLDAKRAKQRLVRSFQSEPEPHAESLSKPITKTASVWDDQNGSSDPAKNATAPKRCGLTKGDMSALSFTLTLLLLGTIAAANTNRPVFWLLIGPAPLAAGFMLLAFFRKGFSWCSPFVNFGKRDDCQRARRQNKGTI
jgi:hypothetical protein